MARVSQTVKWETCQIVSTARQEDHEIDGQLNRGKALEDEI